MNRTVLVLSSLALLLGGCSDKGDSSSTSQVEETTVEDVVESAPAVVEETEVITETAEPAGGDMMPEASDEETGEGSEVEDQGENATENTGSSMSD